MTSDARATALIQQHFLTEWPLVALGVPCAVDGPPSPRWDTYAHLTVWTGASRRGAPPGRLGWIYVRMWCPGDLQLSGSLLLWDAARAVFDGARIKTDDGYIVVVPGERFDVGRDGQLWMSAAAFSFRHE